MKRHSAVLGILALLPYAFVGAFADSSPPQAADIEEAVQEQVRQYYQAATDLDPDMHTRFWSRETIIGFALRGRLETSVDAMTETWHTMAANRTTNNFDCQRIPVRVFSPDTALAMCIGTFAIERTNGNANSYDFVGTTIWAREADGWKLIYLQETSRVQAGS